MTLNDVERKRMSALTRGLVTEAGRIEQERRLERKRLEELALERRRDEALRRTRARARAERSKRIKKMSERIVEALGEKRLIDFYNSVVRKEDSFFVYLEYAKWAEWKRNENENRAKVRDGLKRLPDNELDELERRLRTLKREGTLRHTTTKLGN